MSNEITSHFLNFEGLYSSFYKRAFLFTKSYVYNDMVAEDIVSESLIKLWEQIRKVNVENPNSLLLTILKNRALDYLKHEQIKEEAFKEIKRNTYQELGMRISMLESCDPKEVYSEEVQRILHDTLSNLSKEARQVFEMSRFDGKSNKEIAEELGVSIKNVEYHITKALKALRISLKDYLPHLFFLLSI